MMHVSDWGACPVCAGDLLQQLSVECAAACKGEPLCFSMSLSLMCGCCPSNCPIQVGTDAPPACWLLLLLQDISPAKLRHLRELPYLEELTLGCHHRLIASTVTDNCLAELVSLTNLQHLNLSQCVHVRDAGEHTMPVVHRDTMRSKPLMLLPCSSSSSSGHPGIYFALLTVAFVCPLSAIGLCAGFSPYCLRKLLLLSLRSICHAPASPCLAPKLPWMCAPLLSVRHDVADESAIAGFTKHQRLCRHH